MRQLVNILFNEICKQIEVNKSNIVRLEGFDNPIIYQKICEKIAGEIIVDTFIPKITREKYQLFQNLNDDEWSYALSYLHKGSNDSFSKTITDEYAEKSYVDFNNAITRVRNDAADYSIKHKDNTALYLLMGTESAPDTGGLADTSFVISPKEIIATLSNDYSAWFKSTIESNDIHEEYQKAIHTLYRILFSQISTDILRFSYFIDSLDKYSFLSVQEIISHICETLNEVWNIPSIEEKKYIPKTSALNKGTMNSGKIITSAIKFIERRDDIPTAAALKKLHEKFSRYANNESIDISRPFPEQGPLYTDYSDFEKTVTDFMCGIDLDENRKKLLRTDYSIVYAIVGTKLPRTPKEKATTYTGMPMETYSRIIIDAANNFHEEYSVYPTQIALRVDRIQMSDCTEDQKEDSFQNICNFTGGILQFFNELSIDINGSLLHFTYANQECEDPFNYSNYNLISDKIKCSGKWGDPCKIHFTISASNDDKKHNYEYKWAFSPYIPWLNAFSYLTDVFYSKGSTHILPTLVTCSNIQDYLDCESEDEFYSHLQQFRGHSLFEEHKAEIYKYFQSPITGIFDLVCNQFKNFTTKLTEQGFFNAGNELRILVKSYTDLMNSIHDNYISFTDIQKEKLPLLINIFSITSNDTILANGEMGSVIVPAYNPVVLEKIDAQQLFLRRGFNELINDLFSGKSNYNSIKAKFDNLIQLSAITQATDAIRNKADEYMICKNIWEYFGVYYGTAMENNLLSSSAGLSIVTDDEDASAMLQKTPMSTVIVRNVTDYFRTFPARIDGINIAFIAPTDMQHIVSAIHSITKELENLEAEATINIKLICLNSKKNSASYLRRWLDSYFNDDRTVKVNTYLHNTTVKNKSDVEELKDLLINCDLCFTYNVLQSAGVQFDLSTDNELDKDYEKYPMTFTPDTIPASHGKARRVNISQFQFLAAKAHTQASHIVGYPHSVEGVYRVYRTLELGEVQAAIIEIAHSCSKWAVCIDQAIDRHMLEGGDSKIIGFTTGEGSYGELNVTVSARKDALIDIKQMLKRRITEKFKNWDADRLQKATNYCIDELSKYMDGSRILKALNPYDYEIHSFLAYVLTLQMLGLSQNDNRNVVRSLISLDSYSHWFEDSTTGGDNMRPDFMLVEIPFSENNKSPEKPLEINVKIIECKMGFQNDNHIAKAKTQLEKGLRTMAINWDPNSSNVMHRYWLNQLYRAIIFSPLNIDDTSEYYSIVREKIYNILDGSYSIKWTGDIFAFWLDDESETPDDYEIHSSLFSELSKHNIVLDELICHNCGQMFIQKMLLPEEERNTTFSYNDITSPEESFEDEEDNEVREPEGRSISGGSIPKTSDIAFPFLNYLSDGADHDRKSALEWFKQFYSISDEDCKLVYESNGHLKWETALDSVITQFRKSDLLINDRVGSFHITSFGEKVYSAINESNESRSFFETVDALKETFKDNNLEKETNDSPTADSPTDQSPENEEQSSPTTTNDSGSNHMIVPLEEVRVLIGKDRKENSVYWEFGHPKLANRHILITGTSGQGKTYAIQAMILELARQGISSVVFDYTDGFLPGKLEPEFEDELGKKIVQEVAIINKIPVNPFRLQMIDIPPFGSVPEKSTTVAGRISDILRHVYSFGDQQAASIYSACKQGVDQYKEKMDFSKLRYLLEEMDNSKSKSVLSKMAQFFDMDLFDTDREFNWESVTQKGGHVTVIQLTGLDRELQTVITEIMMWDAWYSLTKFGNKNTPFVVVLDEAQNLSFKEKSPAEKILREGRKYGWSAWFATQFLKGALDSGEISNLQQAAERLYFKPTGEEMSYIADQIAGSKSETPEWLNVMKSIQKGQCVVQGDRIKSNGQFGATKPTMVNVSSFSER